MNERELALMYLACRRFDSQNKHGAELDLWAKRMLAVSITRQRLEQDLKGLMHAPANRW